MNAASEALAKLLNQDWWHTAQRPTFSKTEDGEIIVWAGWEIYRISTEGTVYRIITRGGEVVFLD